jgi:hypothetical protein
VTWGQARFGSLNFDDFFACWMELKDGVMIQIASKSESGPVRGIGIITDVESFIVLLGTPEHVSVDCATQAWAKCGCGVVLYRLDGPRPSRFVNFCPVFPDVIRKDWKWWARVKTLMAGQCYA